MHKDVANEVKPILRTFVAALVAEVAATIIDVCVVVNVGESIISQIDDWLSEMSALRASISS